MQLIRILKTSNMFSKQTLFLIFVLSITNAAHIQPTDLVDEAEKQLKELKEIVSGEIMSGHNTLDSLLSSFQQNSATTVDKAVVDLDQEHDVVLAQLQTLKDLAYSAGKDPSSCTTGQEQTLAILPPRYGQQITDCVTGVDTEAKGISDDARYIIDVSFSTVHHLDDQVSRCNGDLLCISPLLTEIELNKVKLPQNIQTEVEIFDSTLKTLKLSTDYCPDKNLVHYLSLVYMILEDVEECIERLLS